MRLVACTLTAALSAVLLSGCSWLGFGGKSSSYQSQYAANQGGRYGVQKHNQYSAQSYGHAQQARRLGPCQITSPMQPAPQGCRPEQVTLAIGGAQGGYAHGGGQAIGGGYGSHASNVSTSTHYQNPQPVYKRPKLRGQIGLEIDHSVSGDLYETSGSPAVAGYNRALHQEGFITGSPSTGQTEQTTYFSIPETIGAPTISYDDVWTAPLRLTAGLEYILTDHTTVFANAGYTRAEGKKGGGVQIIDELRRTVTTQDYDPLGNPLGPPISNTTFIPNEVVATFDYDFSELERIDFELGGRHYFDPIMQDKLNRTVTPFVAASGGAAYYNDTTVTENQRQRFLMRAVEGTEVSPTGDFYDVALGNVTQIYNAQWVPYGTVKGGVEWQMTPKTALAFEAGVRYEGKREQATAAGDGDAIISIPVAIRGSYNF